MSTTHKSGGGSSEEVNGKVNLKNMEIYFSTKILLFKSSIFSTFTFILKFLLNVVVY